MLRVAAGLTTRIASEISIHLQASAVLRHHTSSFRLFSTEVSRQIRAACILERLPVVVPEEPLFEVQYHELRERLFSKYRRELPSEFTKVAGGDSADSAEGEAGESSFTPAPLVTEADEKHDVKSLHRALDKRLFFLVKSRGADGSEEAWHFPERSHEPGETIRQTAEGALADVLTDDEGRQVYFIGHSPAGYGRYPGWDLFFHRAQLIKGIATLRPGGSVHDFAWVTKEELPEYIKDPNAQKLFNMILAGP
ncbi:probable 39S ribosomal protein L46, mitochondrial at C-terminar half [Coccomyxa sp. Obi]|nr:probable 39S ribosomal protein L46, mitochondrial at C-terminar half [Coccomyxa sp. Obi]